MLSASQPKSPKAMMVSRLVVDSDRLSDGFWEEFMSLLRSAMGRGSKPFIFQAKTMPLPLHFPGCKNYEKVQCHLLATEHTLASTMYSAYPPKGLIS